MRVSLLAVNKTYKVPTTSLISGQRGVANEARKVFQWLLREKCDFPYKDIMQIVGGESIKTVGWSSQEAKRLIEVSRITRSRISKIEKMLQN